MHIFFSGIGGTAIGPLALIARQAGFQVSGSDKQHSGYIDYLREHGLENIHIGQDEAAIAALHARQPIDWYVYSSAVAIEQPDAPEFVFCRRENIHMSTRSELLNMLLEQKHLHMLAIAGTHGKTTTTAMLIWLLRELGLPVSWSVGAKLPFGDMGHYEPDSRYFVYEADEFARNFLEFHPHLSLIAGIDWDHPDIYPTQAEYDQAFRQFFGQSKHVIMWQADADRLQTAASDTIEVIDQTDDAIQQELHLPGAVNRLDAWLVAAAAGRIVKDVPHQTMIAILNRFPGVSRRFEQIVPNLYSDYAHTPPKIRGALQTALETAPQGVVVVYEGLHNTRQHFIKDELAHLFDGAARLYIVPSYLAREDPNLPLLTPADLQRFIKGDLADRTVPSELNGTLAAAIRRHIADGQLVLGLSGGGGGSLDEWLRREFPAA